MFLRNQRRSFSNLLKSKIGGQIPQVKERIKRIQKDHGEAVLDTLKLGAVIGGMRELPCLFYFGSQLDPIEGIRFRGLSIPEMQAALPKAKTQPLPEAVFWLLLTGESPSKEELADLTKSLVSEEALPDSTARLIEASARNHHPMTTLSMAILDLQSNSAFAKRYSEGKMKKDAYWEATLDDGLFLLKHLPRVAALIYSTKYNKQARRATSGDWAGRYAELLGYKDDRMAEVLRGYLAIHSDHEGGNVSGHTSFLVNSALSDPFLSVSAAMNGLAGPLHGLANQEVLKFLLTLQNHLNSNKVSLESSKDPALLKAIEAFVRDWLKTAVVPGYGHGKLRNTDPRFTHLKEQSLELMPDKELVKLVHACEAVIPGILKGLGKVKNPFPNVDAHSGVLLYELGLKEFDYYTVVFGVSRALGCVANMVWARAVGLPLERPGSLTLEKLEEFVQQGAK